MSGEWDSKVCQLCNQELSGRGVWKYCSEYCRNEAKRQRNQEDYAESQEKVNEGYRKHRLGVIRRSRRDSYYGLTEPKLRPLFEHAEMPHEEYTHRDDFCEDALKIITDIKQMIIPPPADLPSADFTSRYVLNELCISLDEQLRDSGHDSTITRIILSTQELLCNIGEWYSAKSLSHISGKAKKLRKYMYAHNEFYGFIHALLFRAEILRNQYYATNQKQFLVEALTWVKVVKGVCNLALKRLPSNRKQIIFLRIYADALHAQLAFDADKPEKANPYIDAVHQRTEALSAYAMVKEFVATARFLLDAVCREEAIHEDRKEVMLLA